MTKKLVFQEIYNECLIKILQETLNFNNNMKLNFQTSNDFYQKKNKKFKELH